MKECGPLTRETKIPFFFGIGRTRAFLEEYGPAAKSHEIHLFILLFEQEEHEAFLKEYGPLMREIFVLTTLKNKITTYCITGVWAQGGFDVRFFFLSS